MSLSSTTNRVSYLGNGSASVYSYTFKVFDDDHLQVIVRDPDDLETVLTKTTHYTVQDVGETAGGTITLVNGAFDWIDAGDLATDYVLSIRRIVPHTQETDIRNQGEFYPEIHEDQFDKLVMADQQQQDEIDRSIKLPESVDPADFNGTLPSTIANPLNAGSSIVVNAAGDGFDLGPSVTSMAAHEADTSTHGVTGDILGTTDAQDVSNKNIDNTNTISAKDTLFTIEDNADATKKIAFQASAVTTATTRTITMADNDVDLGAVATKAGTEVLTNKDIDGGTASNTSRLTVPKDTKANLDALTRKQATLVYATDQGKLYADTGSTLKAIGGSWETSNQQTLSASGTITIETNAGFQMATVAGNGAAVTLSSTPFGTSPPADGSVISLIGASDSNTVQIDANDASHGCVGNFSSIILAKYEKAQFQYSSTLGRYVYVS